MGENESGNTPQWRGEDKLNRDGGKSNRRTRAEISLSMSNCQREHGRIERQLLRDIREWDELELWREDGCANMVQWVSGRLNVSHYVARLRIHCAHAIEILPLIEEALTAGELSLDKTVHLTRFATRESEKDLLKWARRVQPMTIKQEADRRETVAIEKVRQTHRERYLRWGWNIDKDMLLFDGALPAERGLMFIEAIKNVAKEIPSTPQEDEGQEHAYLYSESARRHADALHALVVNEVNRKQNGHGADVVVYTELARVMGQSEAGPQLHPMVVDKLMCDARIRFVVTDQKGNPLGIGKRSRAIPRWLGEALRKRDRHCTFPGCNHKVFVQGHHIKRFPQGPSDLGNLVLVCDFHHDLVHKFGWEVKLEGSIAVWYRPNGKVFLPGPDPPLERSA